VEAARLTKLININSTYVVFMFFTKGQWSRSEQRRDDAAISCDWNGMTSSSMNPIFRTRACAMFMKYPPFKVVDFVVGKMQNFP